jgi:hypothetical protein
MSSSINNFSSFNTPSLNGLIDINADSVNSSSIISDDIESNLINTNQIFVNGIDIASEVANNSQKLTGISYTDIPTPTTIISNSLIVEELAEFDANVNISGTTNLNNTNVTGELLLIDDVDTSKQMKIHWVPTHNGHWFETLNGGAYIYFIVKNMLGNIRAFQFNYDLVYCSIPFFVDGDFSMDTQQFIQGTNGSSMQFIGSGNPWDGWTHKVIKNNYYINWWCRNSGGTDINVFRMHNTKISSFIDHEFTGNIIVSSISLTPTELSYLSGITSNIQTQLNNKLSYSGGVISGNLEVGGTFKVIGNTNLALTNLGLTTINGVTYHNDWTYFSKDIIFAHSSVKLVLTTPLVTLTQTELSYLSGLTFNIQAQLDGKLSLTGGTLSGSLILNSATATNNKLTQSIILSDTFSNNNLFKYSTIAFNSNSASGSTRRCLEVVDNYNGNGFWFMPNSAGGAYNSMASVNSSSIVSGATQNSNALVLTTWSTVKNGIKLSTTGSANAQTELWAGNSSSIVLNNSTGITATNVASLGFTDSTTQTTAFTTAKNTKLNSLGDRMNAVLMGDTTLTTGSFFNAGSIALYAGTWMICVNACLAVITGTTTVAQLLAGYSTSNTMLTQSNNLSIFNCGAINYGSGSQWVLTSTNIVIVPSTQLYYLLVQADFGTPSNLQWNQGNSCFTAIKIA